VGCGGCGENYASGGSSQVSGKTREIGGDKWKLPFCNWGKKGFHLRESLVGEGYSKKCSPSRREAYNLWPGSRRRRRVMTERDL